HDLHVAHGDVGKSAGVRELEHIGTGGGDERGHSRETARTIWYGHREHREPAVGHEPARDDPLDHVDVDVAAGEHHYGDVVGANGQLAGDERRERYGARAFGQHLL